MQRCSAADSEDMQCLLLKNRAEVTQARQYFGVGHCFGFAEKIGHDGAESDVRLFDSLGHAITSCVYCNR